MPDNSDCPCGSGSSYAVCCGLFISGKHVAQTPLQLMRSRYTAYSKADIDYIAATMRGCAARNFEKEQARRWAARVVWKGLEIKSTATHGDQGEVEFIASFSEDGVLSHIQERSKFERMGGRWYYTDKVKPHKVGRNDPCACGSGKKFKHCCGMTTDIG